MNKKKKAIIGPKEKGIGKTLAQPQEGRFEGVELRFLPRFISYKAALLKEKMALKTLLVFFLVFFGFHYMAMRLEIASLHKKLREKEYILAPGVLDFTVVSPQNVPDSYVDDAVSDFLSDLGNISATNVDEQYGRLKRFMSDSFRITFERESAPWVEQIKEEGISQILTVTKREIETDDGGKYHITAMARADFYANQEYLGHEDQIIELSLQLTPPREGKRWYLEITSLYWTTAETFQTKRRLNGK